MEIKNETHLTYNSQDFVPLLDKYWRMGREHYGVIVSENRCAVSCG